MRSAEESPWWCPPATHNFRFAMPQHPLEASIRCWQQVGLHCGTNQHTSTPELQLHKLPQVLTKGRAMKHNQGSVIKTMCLLVNTEQKPLQFFQIAISHAILTIVFFNISSCVQVQQNGCNFKMQILQKNCQAIQYQD